MIAPGLLRRALSRGAQWRLLLASVFAFGLPTALFLLPVSRLLGSLLDGHPQADAWLKSFDGLFALDLVKQLGTPEAGPVLQSGTAGALLTLFLVAPLVAGFGLATARLAFARTDAVLDLRGLFTGSAEVYGRLLRFTVCSVVPLGLFTLPGLLFLRLADRVGDKAITSAAASAASRWAAIGFVLFFVVGQTVADCGRALFAAEPHRRSAFFATFAGFRLFFRRPLHALSIGFSTWLLALVLGALLLRLRLAIPQHSGGAVALAFVVAQLAVAALAFGRSARLIGLAELAQADAAARVTKAAKVAKAKAEIRAALESPQGFEMAPPKTSPPPVAESVTPQAPAPESVAPQAPGPESVAPQAPAPESVAPQAPGPESVAPQAPGPDATTPAGPAGEATPGAIVSPVSDPPKV